MAQIAGLKLIVPSSVAGSGVSVSASGKVTFTAATSVSVNGCFSSTYDNYLVVIRHTASAADNFRLRMRLSGTDNSTASSYVSQYVAANNTTVSGVRTTQDRADIFDSYATQRAGAHVYFYGPALAQPTAMRSVVAEDFSGAYIRDFAVTHNQSVSYDGFTVGLATESLTGALTIYGLSQ